MRLVNFLATIDIDVPKVSAMQLFIRALNIGFYAVGIIAVIMIIFSGFTLVTSAGNAESVKKAKSTITYTVVGLAFIIFAIVITSFVEGSVK